MRQIKRSAVSLKVNLLNAINNRSNRMREEKKKKRTNESMKTNEYVYKSVHEILGNLNG